MRFTSGKLIAKNILQVFVMTPDTTEVQRIPLPRRPVTEEAAVDLDKITSESVDILDVYLKQCQGMKFAALKRVYMLHRVRESVQMYADHLEKLKNFFFHHERIQTEWYAEFCYRLPRYGDYLTVLKDSEDTVKVKGIPNGIAQREVRKLVEGVVANVFDGGNFVISERVLCKNIDENERRKLILKYVEPLLLRSTLLQKIEDNRQIIEDTLYNLNAYVHFLKMDQLESINLPDFRLLNDFEEL